MRKELVFNNEYNDYTKDKYYFQKNKKKPVNTNEIDTEKIVLSNKTPYGEQGVNKYCNAYLECGLRRLHIIIKDIEFYANHMNVLANDNELLKDIETWNRTEALFNKKFNKKGFLIKPIYNNEYIKAKISSYNENVHGNKKLIKDENCGHSILLL